MAEPKVRIYTRSWCEDSQQAKEFLTQRHIPFNEIDIEAHPEAAEFVERANGGKRRTPTLEVDGRTFHCSPYDPKKLERELGR